MEDKYTHRVDESLERKAIVGLREEAVNGKARNCCGVEKMETMFVMVEWSKLESVEWFQCGAEIQKEYENLD